MLLDIHCCMWSALHDHPAASQHFSQELSPQAGGMPRQLLSQHCAPSVLLKLVLTVDLWLSSASHIPWLTGPERACMADDVIVADRGVKAMLAEADKLTEGRIGN